VAVSEAYGYMHNLPNAWMASRPYHPFWIHVLTEIMNKTAKGDTGFIEGTSGPVVVWDSYKEYMKLRMEVSSNKKAVDGETLPPVNLVTPGRYLQNDMVLFHGMFQTY
jgi:hypothetical protein